MRFSDSENESYEDFPLSHAIDNAILMHRDAHFGGQFDIMLDYYQKGGKGIFADFDIQRIEELAEMEKEMKQNLAPLLLTGPEAEMVAQAKDAYKALRDLYDNPKLKGKAPLLIADLILSEEENPEKEIDAIISKKHEIVPALIDLLRSENFYNPLFPGYGLAPALAAKCLGLIGDKRSLISLFESIGESDFFDDNISLEALKAIGEPAKQFLLKVLHGRPLNEDNEKAAIALLQFRDDPEVVKECLHMLKDPEVRKDIALATYLILSCESLQDEEDREQFIALESDPSTPKELRQDFKTISKNWS